MFPQDRTRGNVSFFSGARFASRGNQNETAKTSIALTSVEIAET